MESELAELREINADLMAQLELLRTENKLLKQKVQALLARLFGRKSEILDPNQIQLLLQLAEVVIEPPASPSDDDDPPPSRPPRRGRKAKHTLRVPENLPVREVIIDPQEVKDKPGDYRLIGQEEVKELDVIPQQYFWRRIVRRKWASKKDRSQPPLIVSARRRFLEGSFASAGLVADILNKKYEMHLPLYRQQQELGRRFQIELSRKMMVEWVRRAADWLAPIYDQIRESLRRSSYLQVDETPARYLDFPDGRTAKGYFWVYNQPGGDVLFEWHTSRDANCLSSMLGQFSGIVQSDGYRGYPAYAANRPEITLAGCWAHARRGIFEAKDQARIVAAWLLHQIGLLYAVEVELRERGASAKERQRRRAVESRLIVDRIEKVLRRKQGAYLPKSLMGKAIGYALGEFTRLRRFLDDGRIEIDNNLVENRIRPTAVGKKNWLFIGHPEAGQRSAIIYTIVACCRRLGIDSFEYLRDVLERLPNMTNQESHRLTPAAWLAEKTAQRQAKAA